jgi:hypothetical protein
VPKPGRWHEANPKLRRRMAAFECASHCVNRLVMTDNALCHFRPLPSTRRDSHRPARGSLAPTRPTATGSPELADTADALNLDDTEDVVVGSRTHPANRSTSAASFRLAQPSESQARSAGRGSTQRLLRTEDLTRPFSDSQPAPKPPFRTVTGGIPMTGLPRLLPTIWRPTILAILDQNST